MQASTAHDVVISDVPWIAGQALEGFGVVTLASIMPILAVELMCIVFGRCVPFLKLVTVQLSEWSHCNCQNERQDEKVISCA